MPRCRIPATPGSDAASRGGQDSQVAAQLVPGDQVRMAGHFRERGVSASTRSAFSDASAT